MEIDIRQLRLRCTQSEKSFEQLGQVTMTPRGPYIWIDRGSSVLAIAHLDSVIDDSPFCTLQTGNNIIAHHGAMDDRLGAYIILDLLPSLGIVPDVLLTTGEESGNSTAQYFKPPKEYNWMFQFDRAGCDVVLYEYEHDKLVSMLEECGFIIHDGLFSDISLMDGLGISGINFGCAYYNNHSVQSHAFMQETSYMVTMFQKFWMLYKDTRIDAPPIFEWEGYRGSWGWGGKNSTIHTMADVHAVDWGVFEDLVEFYLEAGYTEAEAEAMAWSTSELEEIDKKELMLEPCPICGYLINPKDHWTIYKYDMCTYCWEEYKHGSIHQQSLHALTQEQFDELQERGDG